MSLFRARGSTVRFTAALTAAACAAGVCCARMAYADEAPKYQTQVVGEVEAAEPRDDRAASSSVITSHRTPRAGEDLPQLLSELPGVDIVRYGGPGAFSTMSLRGSTPNQVQVYVDDVPLNVATGGGVDLGFLPLAQLDRIEVYRGSSPLQFGASGIGGVLSLRTQVPEGSTASVTSSAGSFGARAIGGRVSHETGAVRGMAGVQAYTWLGGYPYENNRATTFESGDDRRSLRLNSDLSQYDANFKLDVPRGARTLSASAILNHREQGAPGEALNPAKHARFRARRLQTQVSFASRGDLGPGSRLHANIYVVATDYAFSDPFQELLSRGARTDDRFRTYGAALRPHWLLGSTRLRTILEATRQDYAPFDGVENQDPAGAPGSRTSLAVGAEADFWSRLWRLAMLPSLRLELARDVVSGRQRFTGIPEASPPELHLLPVVRLAFIQHATERLHIHGNVGRYVRLPSTTELYGNNGYVRPNPALQPESGVNADLGVRFATQGPRQQLILDAAAFANFADNLIQYLDEGGQSRADNISRARTLGLELAAQARLARVVHLTAQFTRLDARNLSDVRAHHGRLLPLRWPWRFFVRPELRDLPISASLRAGAYADLNFASGAYPNENNTNRIATRWLLGAGVTLLHEPLGLRLMASAFNLADTQIVDQMLFPLPGRSFFLSLSWHMSFSPQPHHS